jgi:beta-glucosidase
MRNGRILRSILISASTALLISSLFAQSQTPKWPLPDSPAIDARAQSLLQKLTIEEKIDLIGGDGYMFIRGNKKIGLPPIRMSDASVGVHTPGPNTAYPASTALAATWDRALSAKQGTALAEDAHAYGVSILLGPGVNILRSPIAGRNFEYLSEDPYLAAQLVVPYVRSLQAGDVVATVKHYAANNQEYDRHRVNSVVDERTLREIYLPAFEAAVVEGGAGSVMNSYNLVNGEHATQNSFLNNQVLKHEWKFDGILMSDWSATYDGVAAANGGLDLEMPSAKFMNRATLLPALKAGSVTEATINDKVLRILRTAIRFGFLDPNYQPQDLSDSLYNQKSKSVALNGARESITLLKNDGVLPLKVSDKTIAVIGPDAWPAVTGGGGSSHTDTWDSKSIFIGLSDHLAGRANVIYTRGLPDLAKLFSATSYDHRVNVETYPNRNFSGTAETSTAEHIDGWRVERWAPSAPTAKSIRYSAEYTPMATGNYLVVATATGEDSYKLWMNDKLVLEQTKHEGQTPRSIKVAMTAGQTIKIQVDYVLNAAIPRFGLGIRSMDSLISDEAKQMARLADVVVVAVGFDPIYGGEGFDRSFELPWGQDELIESLASLNKKTVVALTGEGSVDTRRWLDKVPGLVDLYYPGEEGGTALAEILTGARNPEGKLPFSFDRSWEENPSYNFYYSKPDANGREQVIYGDKLMVGYRYWTTVGKKPLFPFGFGLSYTSFQFSNLKLPATAKTGDTVTVEFDVTNTGQREGAEVAELYVSDPSATVERPERELKGFEKVRLAPGESKHVSLELNARSFSYWSTEKHDWTIDPGKFIVRVGDASDATPLNGEIVLSR